MKNKEMQGRIQERIRPIVLKYDFYGYADASVLYEAGDTKVLVTVFMQQGVPKFLKGHKSGWLTAEYAMLPGSTPERTQRESSQVYKNSRNVEISRFIGRCLRSVVNLLEFPDKTIIVDCDVLKADGSTRVAGITAACQVLLLAQNRWLNEGRIKNKILNEEIAAVSVGKVNEKFYLDLDFLLDKNAHADFNFVISKSGKLIEIQGTAEKEPLNFQDFEKLKELALKGINQIFAEINKYKENNIDLKTSKLPMFSLSNRLNNKSL